MHGFCQLINTKKGVYNMGFNRWGDSTHKMTAFRHFSESTELDLSFNELTEVRAGMWKVSNMWGDSTHKMTAFRHFSESTELDLSFNELTEVRAGLWKVSNRWGDSTHKMTAFLALNLRSWIYHSTS